MNMESFEWQKKIEELNTRRRQQSRKTIDQNNGELPVKYSRSGHPSTHLPFLDYFLPDERYLLRTMELESIVRTKPIHSESCANYDNLSDDEVGPPASEELFFDAEDLELFDHCDPRKEDGTSVKPLTSLESKVLGYLQDCHIKKYDDITTTNRNLNYRMGIVRSYIKQLKQKRYNKAYNRFKKVRAKNLNLEDEAIELQNREIADKNLLREYYYGEGESPQCTNLLQVRIQAIKKKYELYVADPEFRQMHIDRTYFNANLEVPKSDTDPQWRSTRNQMLDKSNIADSQEFPDFPSYDSLNITDKSHKPDKNIQIADESNIADTNEPLFDPMLDIDELDKPDHSQWTAFHAKLPDDLNIADTSELPHVVSLINGTHLDPIDDDLIVDDDADQNFYESLASHVNDLLEVKRYLLDETKSKGSIKNDDLLDTNAIGTTKVKKLSYKGSKTTLQKNKKLPNTGKTNCIPSKARHRSKRSSRRNGTKYEADTNRETTYMQSRKLWVSRTEPLPGQSQYGSGSQFNMNKMPLRLPTQMVDAEEHYQRWQEQMRLDAVPINNFASDANDAKWNNDFDKILYENYRNEAFQSYQEESGFAIASSFYNKMQKM